MKLVINKATEELEMSLKDRGYLVETYDDETPLFTEVEKIVEVEKEIPEYLKVIEVEVEKLVDAKVAEKEKEYESYKDKIEAIKSIFGTEKVETEVVDE